MPDTKELIQQYCSAIDDRLLILLGIIAFLWLIEPAIQKKIDNIHWEDNTLENIFGGDSLKVIYKWIGIGLIFMAGLVIYIK